MLSKLLAVIKANPAIVSYVLTVASGAIAHYGFHVSPGQLLGVLAAVGGVLHTWLHFGVTNPPKPPAAPPAA